MNTLCTKAYDVAQQMPKNALLCWILPTMASARLACDLLRFFAPERQEDIHYFASWETLPYDPFSPPLPLISSRLDVLSRLPTLERGVVISALDSTLQRLCPQTHLDRFGISLKVGARLPQAQLIERLQQAGYQRCSILNVRGEYAHRGAIVDLFPMGGAPHPIRIEWFDDEVESIRTFSVATHETLHKLPSIHILPSSELDLSESGRVCFRQSSREILGERFSQSGWYETVSKGAVRQGMEYYLPLFFDETMAFFDYLPKHTQLLLDEDITTQIQANHTYFLRRFERLDALREHTLLPPKYLWLDEDEWTGKAQAFSHFALKSRAKPYLFTGSEGERMEKAQTLLKTQSSALHCHSMGLRESLHERLLKEGIALTLADTFSQEADENRLYCSPLTHSFITDDEVVHIAESDLHEANDLTHQHWQRGADTASDAKEVMRSLQDLRIGQAVVHVDYGVGRYLGLETLEDEEMLIIEYAKGARVYVSASDADLVSKYTQSGDSEQAPQHELGGKTWQKLKRNAKKKARDVAAELLKLYAQREASTGHALIFDKEDMQAFAQTFDYEETPDQRASIEAVLGDLMRPRPMDRMVCGDVGFGKTEVAVRAAYAAILAGKQVALLAPTTLLAEQHYHHFCDRFSHLPIQLAVLSRFKTAKEQTHILSDVANSKVDMVIGTHRLLQEDVHFHDLGLLIVDEEQRFGVRHKEKLKQLRADVNLLTLTATPIPRTLNMALSGLRDLSLISTPPKGRQSVQTLLIDFDPQLIEDACERELKRGGQVFFLHNDVASIERQARTLQEILPQARIAIAHGQMKSRELENIMLAFYNRHYDILLASTIIESGIDIPNANTIIINRADKLGLSQLHQLRGRVGRSHQQAYAYLITPPLSTLNKDAQRRLEAFVSLDSLGAGFLLASQDLDIRGAGEILGDEQSGQIQEIGMNYYLDLLARATLALQNGQSLSMEDEEDDAQSPVIELNLPALLPGDYIFDPQVRLGFYQRLSRAQSIEEIEKIRVKIVNTYGVLPPEGETLFARTALKYWMKREGIEKIQREEGEFILHFQKDANINSDKLFADMQKEPHKYRFKNATTVSLICNEGIDEPNGELRLLLSYLESLAVADN